MPLLYTNRTKNVGAGLVPVPLKIKFGENMIAEVIINSNVKNLNRIFDYKVPTNWEGTISVGDRILVPFGNKKALEEGFVIGLKESSNFKVKEIVKIQEGTRLTKDNIALAKLMARRYFCNISDCIKLMLPPGTSTKLIENRVKEKNANFVYLLKEIEEIQEDIENKVITSEKQKRVLNFLIQNDDIQTVDLEILTDTTSAVLRALEKKGYVEIVQKPVERNPFIHKKIEKGQKLILTEEQQYAFNRINQEIQKNQHKKFLIEGVTGSGKTEIYLQLIEQVLVKGQTAIVLVPEISLTPQMVDRFIARFGEEKIAVLHSKLSLGERYDQWNKIKKGECNIVIGARSAVFAPVENLGLMIIDEEHDSSYKSETNPRYNAKELAGYMAKQNNIPLVLGSATPDMTTYYQAKQGEIELLRLTKRANKATLPTIEVVDLRQELANGNRGILSAKLYDAIEENLKNKKQTILFLNRRGYATFVMCRDCGHTVKCKNCNITMTYHAKNNKLKCHYCGFEQKNLTTCPECKSHHIKYFGTGTQKLEEEIHRLFPSASTIRMDIDTVTKKNSHENILNQFKKNGIDILIGTQMVVKGHHFPKVTLVGVIAADSSIFSDDYRANERTFQILTQVAGRAGREKEPGKVIIQTYNPDNFAIECSKKQDYVPFYETEIELRKQLKYPPFCDIISVVLTDVNETTVKKISQKLYKTLAEIVAFNHMNVQLYQPLPCPIDKIKNKYRWRIIMKGKLTNQMIEVINKGIETLNNKKTRIIVDTNPTNLT